MKVLKNILLAAAVCGGLSLTACTGSFLDEDSNPNVLSPSTFWQSETDILKGLTSAYGALQPTQYWAEPFERYVVIDSYRGDDCDFRADVSSWMALAMFTNESTSSLTEAEWTYLFQGINYANQCIDNIPNVPDEVTTAEFKKQTVAEARFLRAYFYYRLFINFGENLPLYQHQLEGTEEEFYPAQAAPGEIVKFIENELQAVQTDLPESYSAAYAGRATRYAAAALLGKFYMFRHEMTKAETELAKLIGKFSLMPNYFDNFDGLHKNNAESVFEVQFSCDRGAGQREYNLFAVHLASEAAFDGGYEEAYPTPWLFETMKKDLTVDGKYSERLLRTIVFDDPDCHTAYYGEGESFSDYHSEGQIFWNKFVLDSPSERQWWGYSDFNYPIIRYADVLLLYAECLNDRGATDEAIDYINEVRARVNVVPLQKGMSKAEVLKHLQDVERPCELSLEGSRWYDLIRWGIVDSALKEHNKPYATNFVDTKHTMLPIPHKEFLMNPDWVQNPGYSK